MSKEEKKEKTKEEKKEIFIHDTKVLFDSLRNLGLCMLFVFVGHFGFAADGDIILRYIGYAVGSTLFILIVIWAYSSSKEKGIRYLTIIGMVIILGYLGYGLYKLKIINFETAVVSTLQIKSMQS